ncbi:hypothetical protein CPB84DRAFT_1843438 [Gymnopilus junonius]|uniref:Uncharacterized protein n=1 Tax=Gymnopilus junonius TaxID=109634 RepID=A0A9P5TR18_GYMJU|nr:hypothetical protein CPB84DRAFT_1843438 [Gymnopilus junonius]
MVKFTSILPRAAFIALATLSSVVKADPLAVTSPSSSIWWVAKSQNVLSWTCANTTFPQFTVLVANSDPTILVSPLAIIAQQDNFDCSIIVTQDQSNQAAGQGWTILLANPLNNTDVYATSQPFEIKPLGSLYPSQVTPTANASSASQTGGASGSSPSPTTASAALSNKVLGWSVLAGAVAAVVGLML